MFVLSDGLVGGRDVSEQEYGKALKGQGKLLIVALNSELFSHYARHASGVVPSQKGFSLLVA